MCTKLATYLLTLQSFQAASRLSFLFNKCKYIVLVYQGPNKGFDVVVDVGNFPFNICLVT